MAKIPGPEQVEPAESLITDEIRSWIGRSDPIGPIEVTRGDIVKYSIATEQQQERYLRGDEAPPLFLFGAIRPVVPMDELGPDGLAVDKMIPKLPLERVMAGGSRLRFLRPVVAGDVLEGERTIDDIVEKRGSTGPLMFINYKITLRDADGETVVEETQTRIAR